MPTIARVAVFATLSTTIYVAIILLTTTNTPQDSCYRYFATMYLNITTAVAIDIVLFLSAAASTAAVSARAGGNENSIFPSTSMSKRRTLTKIPHKADGLSSCLLVKDDNSKLGEWIGYHWMQGMQHLIVAVDPSSKTSPKDVLNTWKEITGMDIILWNDPDFRYVPSVEETPLKRHRNRQRSFLIECFRHHKAKGRRWTFHIDTDEFIANNIAFGEGQSTIIRDDQTLWEYLINEDIATPSTVDDLRNEACIHMPRLTFSAVEEHDQEILKNLTVVPFEPKNFNTLRFFHHADPSSFEHNKYGKTLVNLEHVPFHWINRDDIYTIHSPFEEICGKAYQNKERFPFMVHHYIGSWEQYNQRGDFRRSREIFQSKAFHAHNKTYHLQSWLKLLVGKVGLVNCTRLLEGAGTVQKIDIDAVPLEKMPDYPTSRGGVESYRYREEDSDCFYFFKANGDRGEVRIVVDENHKGNITDKTKTSRANVTESCALMFFGLSRSFRKKAFPSIKQFILDANPSCEIFVHTYDIQNEDLITSTQTNQTIFATDVLLLTDVSKVMIETKEDFQMQVNASFYHQFFPTPSTWEFPRSMDNMIMQWHSIAKVWELMVAHEKRVRKRFDRVGYFRLDVIYTHPIPFSDGGEQEQAVIPSMMYQPHVWGGLNDRMFYGRREFAEVWATHRFGTVHEYMKWQGESSIYGDRRGLHSEDYMRYLLTIHGHLPLRIKNICFKRVRSTGNVQDYDCKFLRSSVDTDLLAHTTDFQSSETDSRSRSAPGVIILGMHRSGTSMLTGLLQNVFSWKVPGRPVKAELDPGQNAKGFFENMDVTRQNDAWLNEQGKTWDSLKMFTFFRQEVMGRFDERLVSPVGENGEIALKEFNHPSHMPWAMKDPRMCITLGAWMPLLESDLTKPPILFIYRNPLEVALSLQARKRNPVTLHEGLQLWIWYNREAIRLSSKMCRVITSNEEIARDPEAELYVIQDKLSFCGLEPKTFDSHKVSEFVDKSLRHSLHHHHHHDNRTQMHQGQRCTIPSFEDTNVASHDAAIAKNEKVMYEIAMSVFCDLQSKKAFEVDYKWPDIPVENSDRMFYFIAGAIIIMILVGTLKCYRLRSRLLSRRLLPLFQKKKGLARKNE